MSSSKSPLLQAIDHVGGQTELARRLTQITGHPVKQGHVSTWLKSKKGVPGEYCVPIEKLVNGKILCTQLRPDIFPPEHSFDSRSSFQAAGEK